MYSLGATLFHALAGRPPFDGEAARDVVMARFKKPAPSLRSLRPVLHPETTAVVARMLEADPGKRYPAYDSLLGDIRGALAAVRQGGSRSRAAPPKTAPKKSTISFVSTCVAGGVIIVALIVFFVFSLGMNNDDVPRPRVNGSPASPPRPYDSPPARTEQTSTAVKKLPGGYFVPTIFGEGADTYIHGQDGARNLGNMNFGNEALLLIRNQGPERLDSAAKIYLRFDLSTMVRARIADVALQLTLAEKADNRENGSRKLNLWLLTDQKNESMA